MSASRVGMTMPLETKARIAATQRRRHAASRVLKAVEAFHRDADFSSTPGTDNVHLLQRTEQHVCQMSCCQPSPTGCQIIP